VTALVHFDPLEVAARGEEVLVVDLEVWEGPLDVLLELARSQKVDLLQISVTRLADQYLAFVRAAQNRNLVVAADYLLMAAWLAYLKSRLLLPRAQRGGEEEAPEALAARLTFRLAKLDAMRRAYQALEQGPVLGRTVFARGDPQAIRIVSTARLEGDLYGLMDAYVSQRRRERERSYSPPPAVSYPLDDAREMLRALLPELERWTPLGGVAPMGGATGPTRASFVASTLSASLELVREGDLEARQTEHFAEIYLRARKAAA
jgi:segregation and condensation protein A